MEEWEYQSAAFIALVLNGIVFIETLRRYYKKQDLPERKEE